MPSLTVVAGPNGAGKSTLILDYPFEGKENLLDTDAIAKRINPGRPLDAALAAGREVVDLSRQYIASRKSFVWETTFSGNLSLKVIRAAKADNYWVNLLYIYLSDPELAIERVNERVSKGGHFVPADDVRRRYERSLHHLTTAITLVDCCKIFDNSTKNTARLVAEIQAGQILSQADDKSPWLSQILACLP
jgi:predicted ABC-type ATPase